MKLFSKVGLIGSLALSVISCGPAPLQTIVISGNVTLDGTPIEAGGIQFTPKDGKNPTTGAMINAGKYTANVPKGKMKVSITAAKVIGLKKTYDVPDSPMENISEEMIPTKYNSVSTLEIDVQGANPDTNFDLKQ